MGETTVSNEQEQNDVPSEYLLDLTKGPDNQQKPDPQPEAEDDVPEKYKGKSLKDIIEMHRNAESALGRAHNEVGQVRKLADALLGLDRAATARTTETAPARKPITPDEILQDPEKAVVTAAKEAADQRVGASEERLARMEYELSLARFEQKHPQFRETMEDEGFRNWVQKSPLRQRLAYGATQGDFASADELFSLYSEVKGSEPDSEQPSQQDAARRATLARPGGSTAARVVDTAKGKPIFSREKLMEMRLNNPDEFERLQPQILQAYAEKRVR